MSTAESFRDELIALLPRLLRYARSLSSTREDAEDLLQATCERALGRWHQFHNQSSDQSSVTETTPASTLDRWTFTIMTSVHRNQQRTLARRGFETDLPVEALASIDESVEWNSQLQQVLQQVEALALAQRQVMLLVYVEEFSYREAAAMLDVPIGTVMSRIARARVKLAEYRLDNPVSDSGKVAPVSQ